MINISPIANKQEFDYFLKLLQSSFPKEKYRNIDEVERLFNDKTSLFKPSIIKNDNTIIGLISSWKIDSDITYYEHLAIEPSLRCGGIGSEIIEAIKAKHKTIVFECEIPNEEMSSRRLNFYLRHEAKIIDKDYHQPPYRKEDKPTPMYLMYFGNKVEHTIAHKIAKIVYPSF